MATTTHLQHPCHDQHPLEPRDFSKVDSDRNICDLCNWKISADGYACLMGCEFYVHRVCAEAPPRIDSHPLHTDHPLTLIYCRPLFENNFCNSCYINQVTLFRCDECDFNLDIRCAFCIKSYPEQIKLPFHPHPLTSFSTKHDFIGDGNCLICKESVEGDGYTCLNWRCKLLIHKACIQDLYYTDGTKAPQIYHGHPLETFLGEETGLSRCTKCGSDESRDFIGCAECQVSYCRDCVQVPETIQYHHHPEHTLALFIYSTAKEGGGVDFWPISLEGELCYGCPSCGFFEDTTCALQVLSYCEEGMSPEIKLSWHEHPLHLHHRTEYYLGCCSCCEDKPAGPMYVCKEEGCEIQLHKRCNEIESTILHPHHPDHTLTLGHKADFRSCEACSETIRHLNFSCKLCAFYVHAKCAAHVPNRKHYLHEHELIHLEKASSWKCIRCSNSTNESIFRCVRCNFNLHEACMELPRVVKSEIHWHPLTLQEIFLEDDSGEYYCEHCEKRRDGRLGVYVCGKCKLSLPRIYHIECVLPELGKSYANEIQTSAIERMAERITIKSGQVRAAEEKVEEDKRVLDELKRELGQLLKKNEVLISGGIDPE